MSVFRIGGLATGINFVDIVEQLMALERRPLNMIEDKKQLLSWKKDFWSEIQTSLSALDKSVQALLQKSTMMARTASSADQTIATATATSEAAVATYTVNVTTLATSTKLASGTGASGLGLGGAIDPNQPISSYTSKFHTYPTAGTFTVNGVVFTLTDTDSDSKIDKIDVADTGGGNIYTYSNASGVTLNEVATAFNDANVTAATGVSASYSGVTDKFSVTANAPGGNLNLGSGGDTSNFLSAMDLLNAQRVGDTKESVSHLGKIRTTQILGSANFATALTADANGDGKFTINGIEIAYNKNTDTLQNVIDRINASTAGVTATYDGILDKLVLTNKATGSTAISRADVTGNFLAAADLLGGASETLGVNASFTVSGLNNGNPISSQSNDVSGIIAGVTLHLKKQGQTDITIDKDNTKAKEAIKDFIDKYNAALTLINTRLSEERVKDPKVLSDKKFGLLRSDRALFEIKSNLVNKTISSVPGLSAVLDQLAEVGVTITSDDFGKSGNLVLDEAKLDAKLNDNAAAVASLFFNDTDGDGKVDAGEDGVAARVAAYMDQIIERGGKQTVTRYEDDSTGISYTGTWNTVADAGASGGTIKQSANAGDAVEFTFTGSAISWSAMKDPNQGIAKVYIDGVYRADVDLYSSATENGQAVFSEQGLSYGQHTVRIEVSGNKNASSAGYGVNIDALDATFTSSTGLIPRQQDVLQSEIDYLNKSIESMEIRLEKREDTMIRQFVAMEASVSRLQQMGNWLQAQLAGMFGG